MRVSFTVQVEVLTQEDRCSHYCQFADFDAKRCRLFDKRLSVKPGWICNDFMRCAACVKAQAKADKVTP
jgi:hypothetical protein